LSVGSRFVRLIVAIQAERRTLMGCLVILTGAVLVFASLLYAVERHAQPDKFGTIPDAMWWAIVTLGTVGYGDAVQVTVLGKMSSVFTIIGGLAMIALPVAIVSSAFADEVKRRDFVVTWGMLARVPLFAHLSAGEIAQDAAPGTRCAGFSCADRTDAGACRTCQEDCQGAYGRGRG
jgi:voltage-gated potassium channel